MPEISVIITTHNGRRDYCEKAINSVLKQSYKDFELIIIDDASNDGTKEMVKAIKDPRIHYVKRNTNFGNDTKPKNEGIILSKGTYIALLDSDNEYNADHLMVLYKHIQKVNTDVVYGDRMVIDDNGELDPQVGIASDFNIELLFTRNYIDTSDVLIKKEALLKVGGFDERYRKYIDWNLWVRMAKAGCTFSHIPKVITYYHLHPYMKSVMVEDEGVGKYPLVNTEPVFRPAWDPMELEIVLPYLGQEWKPKVAIYTLTMNRLEYTKKMYQGLKKSGYSFDWFVVDQGSTDGTVEWLKSIQNPNHIFVRYNKENVGISIGTNQALEMIFPDNKLATYIDYDIVIKIDNDCYIQSDDWLFKLIDIFKAHWKIALSPRVEGLVDNPGGSPRIAYKTLRGHLLGITTHIGGIFTATHKSAYDNFRFDKDDFLHGIQDMIFSSHLNEIGCLPAYVEDLTCEHYESTDGQKERYPEYFKDRTYQRTHTYKEETK